MWHFTFNARVTKNLKNCSEIIISGTPDLYFAQYNIIKNEIEFGRGKWITFNCNQRNARIIKVMVS